jgi:molybdopterin converting factor small subunit
MKVLLYGRLAEAIDHKLELDAPSCCSVAELRAQLVASHPATAEPLKRSRVLVGNVVADDSRILQPEDRVEFLPPVSGG